MQNFDFEPKGLNKLSMYHIVSWIHTTSFYRTMAINPSGLPNTSKINDHTITIYNSNRHLAPQLTVAGQNGLVLEPVELYPVSEATS